MNRLVQPVLRPIAAAFIGAIVGLVCRELLPSKSGISILRGSVTILMPFNRMAFWICVFGGMVGAIGILVRAMFRDLIP